MDRVFIQALVPLDDTSNQERPAAPESGARRLELQPSSRGEPKRTAQLREGRGR